MLLDDQVLGRVADFEDNEIPQDIISGESLFIHNQNELLKSIKRRISKYELDYLMDQVKTSNNDFWREVIKRVSGYYTLNSLRSFLTPSFTKLDFAKETIKLLYFLKVRLPEVLFDNNIDYDFFSEANDFEKFLEEKKINIVPFFKFVLKYIDRDSFREFIRTIISESKTPYSE